MNRGIKLNIIWDETHHKSKAGVTPKIGLCTYVYCLLNVPGNGICMGQRNENRGTYFQKCV